MDLLRRLFGKTRSSGVGWMNTLLGNWMKRTLSRKTAGNGTLLSPRDINADNHSRTIEEETQLA